MLFRAKTLLAKIESAYGTDPTPTGTDAILTSNLAIQPYAGPVVSRNNDRETLGSESSINTNPQVILTFETEIAGAGTAGAVPAYDSLLRACGFSGASDASPATSHIYTPVSTGFESVTFYFYHDGQRHKVIGSRGTFTINLSRGEIPRMAFTFTGTYTRPDAATPSGTDIADFVAPVPVTNTNTPTYVLDDGSPLASVVAESFSVDIGNNVIARNVINNEEIMITDRNATGNTVIEAPDISTRNWFSDAESNNGVTLLQLSLVHGTTAGNIVAFDCPSVQLTSLSQDNSDDLVVYNMGLSLIPVSGNDEITITVR
jgi:hypothetical protein